MVLGNIRQVAFQPPPAFKFSFPVKQEQSLSLHHTLKVYHKIPGEKVASSSMSFNQWSRGAQKMRVPLCHTSFSIWGSYLLCLFASWWMMPRSLCELPVAQQLCWVCSRNGAGETSYRGQVWPTSTSISQLFLYTQLIDPQLSYGLHNK